jgi:Flp pilus assembly pilin Flp
MLEYLRKIRVSERGTSAVEYGLLVAGVALACIVASQAMGFALGALFEQQTSVIEECHSC